MLFILCVILIIMYSDIYIRAIMFSSQNKDRYMRYFIILVL